MRHLFSLINLACIAREVQCDIQVRTGEFISLDDLVPVKVCYAAIADDISEVVFVTYGTRFFRALYDQQSAKKLCRFYEIKEINK